MTKELLEELGWKFDDFWNNRAFYSLSKESKFSIFEHDGWGLLNPFNKDFELIYCDLSIKTKPSVKKNELKINILLTMN